MSINKTKLICIPFSGGNAYSYSVFKNYFPENIEFINIELPGRGKRISEKLLYTIDSMTNDLFKQIENEIDGHYVIFGHSLGALLAYTLCRNISDKDLELPKMLFLSGQTAPSLIEASNKNRMTENEIIEMLRDMGGTPEELLTDKGFLQFFLPVIKADFKSIAEYNYKYYNLPLNVPFTIMYGNEEKTSLNEAEAWQKETINTVSVHHFNGGHFFIFNQTELICGLINEKINLLY